jgi:RHS repeat-associated protein
VAAADGSSYTYVYDALSRLTGETRRILGVTTQFTYTYDAFGNRTSISSGGTTTTLAYNSVDELTGDGTSAYTYDANGNTTRVSSAAGATIYAYDTRNRLTQVTLPDGTTSSSQYGSDGNRIQTRTGAATVNYLVDSAGRLPNVVLETDAQGNVLASYTYGVGLISQRRGGVDSFYGTDALGSVRLLTDSGGAVTDTYTYGSFGDLLGHTGTTVNSRMFTGEQLDSAAGLYYLRARYYNPTAGRFLTADSFAGVTFDPRTHNRYAYALDNPINNTDPLGLYSPGDGGAIHKIIGQFYIGIWGDYFQSIGRRPNRGFPSGGGFGAYDRGVLNGGAGWRPDLRNYLTGDVYEIKPLTPYGVVEGPVDLAVYIAALNILEPGAPWLLGAWFPGMLTYPPIWMFAYGGGTVETFAFPMVGPGLIFYTNNLARDLLAVGAVASAAVLGILAAQRLIMMAPAMIAAWQEADFAGSFALSFI